jgi:hypothetical protein
MFLVCVWGADDDDQEETNELGAAWARKSEAGLHIGCHLRLTAQLLRYSRRYTATASALRGFGSKCCWWVSDKTRCVVNLTRRLIGVPQACWLQLSCSVRRHDLIWGLGVTETCWTSLDLNEPFNLLFDNWSSVEDFRLSLQDWVNT